MRMQNLRSLMRSFAAEAPSGGGDSYPDTDFLRRLLKNLPGVVYRCRVDADWTMEYVSGGVKELTGFAPDDFTRSAVVTFGRLIHPDDRTMVQRTVLESLGRDAPFRLTYRIRRVDGTERQVWEQGVGVRGPDGHVETIEGFITDITDRTELAEAFDDRGRLFRAVTEQSLTGVYLLDEGGFQYVNPRFAEIFGYSVDQIVALPSFLDLVHEQDRALVSGHVRERLSGEVPVARYEFRGIRKDGSECEVQVQGSAVHFRGAPAVAGVLLDVTGRKRAERRYHEAQKMEALGRMAAGVAHDFNNVLAVIGATAALLRAEATPESRSAHDLNEISKAVERGAGLSRQLMAFGMVGSSEVSHVSLADLVSGSVALLERMVGGDVELTFQVDPKVPLLRLDPTQAEQIVMNLVLNARDAMPLGGDILVAVRWQPHGANCSSSRVRDQPHVVLEVRDTGIGIPEDVRPRLFEPYFTTKGDRGTGLGLGNVWRIASEAGGCVDVQSSVGEWTSFSVYFPVDTVDAASAVTPP